MGAARSSTSLERTYRYLRIGLAGTVVVIFISVGVAAGEVGWLTSVSEYFYTPARNAFVGALLAAALALVALSGRGADRALLDAAALFAPLIALVPTTVVPGSVPGVEVDAACEPSCFPAEYIPDAANGVTTYLVVGGLIVLVVLLLAALGQVAFAAVGWSLAATGVVLIAVASAWLLAREAFLQYGHVVATVAFFGLFASVALLSAAPRRGARQGSVYRVLYAAIAVGLVLVLIAYLLLLPRSDDLGFPLVLVVEASALLLFCAFWVAQGVEKWHDPDPALR
jgi:hypothetical protein